MKAQTGSSGNALGPDQGSLDSTILHSLPPQQQHLLFESSYRLKINPSRLVRISIRYYVDPIRYLHTVCTRIFVNGVEKSS